MKVRQVRIENFRGISKLDWTTTEAAVCLVGPGDAGKTTILDAIETALAPVRQLWVSDADFYGCEPSDPIMVEVTVSPVPELIKKDQRFHTLFRAWDGEAVIDEPSEEGHELALTVRFSVDDRLDPEWLVVTDRDPEGIRIGHSARASLGVTRVSETPDIHLSWGRGSVLARLASADGDAESALEGANREARRAVDEAELAELRDVASRVAAAGSQMGVGSGFANMTVRMDPSRSGLRASGLGLHAGNVPVGRAGIGTRRLLAIAAQRLSTQEGAIVLVDEVEQGLEPHRLQHLLRELSRDAAGTGSSSANGTAKGQALMTTHSPAAIRELAARSIHVVRRSEDGAVRVLQADDSVQGLLRSQPEAILGRSVVLCEGATEVGFLRGLDSRLRLDDARPPLADLGVAVADGGGTQLPELARGLNHLGCKVAAFVDADQQDTLTRLAEFQVTTLSWSESLSTEERLARDLPINGLFGMIAAGIEERGVQSVRDAISSKLEDPLPLSSDPVTWLADVDDEQLRRAVGLAAKGTRDSNGWFKRTDHGVTLGRLAAEHWESMEETNVRKVITELGDWIFGDLT